MFSYLFIQRAFLVGIISSFIIPLIGIVVVSRKTSTIGDALSHSTLAGILFGVIVGINPLVTGIIICVLSALSIEIIRNRFPKNGDMATAIITSLAVGLSSVLSDKLTVAQNFESFLFGSIISISNKDIYIILIMTIIILIMYLYTYYGILAISINKDQARLSGVNVTLCNYFFTIITAVTIAISSKLVGVLIISSLMILPVATAMLLAKNYKKLLIFSVIIAQTYFVLGFFASYYMATKPGGAIIIASVLGFSLTYIYTEIFKIRN